MLRRYMPSSVTFTLPQGGYFLWLKLPDGVSSVKLSQQLAEYKITVACGSLFAANGECDGFLRLNTTFAHLAETEQAIKQMGDLLRLTLTEATV
ncbi:transcriptional regulator GntR family domain [Vibrio ponticus]|nr:transcriptional regulator GntR family domain [Vibrio ponticus]